MSNFCGKCGTKLNPEQIFCTNCGTKFEKSSNSNQLGNIGSQTNKMTMEEYAKMQPKPKKAIGCLIVIVFLGLFIGIGLFAGFLMTGPYEKISGMYYCMVDDKMLFLESDYDGGDIISLEGDNKLYIATKSKEGLLKDKYELEFSEYLGNKSSKYQLNIKPNKLKLETEITYIENDEVVYKENVIFKKIDNNKYFNSIGQLDEKFIGKYKGTLTIKESHKKDFDDIDQVSFSFEIGKDLIVKNYDSEISVPYDHDNFSFISYKGDVIEIKLQETEEAYEDPEYGTTSGRLLHQLEIKVIPVNGDLVGYFDLCMGDYLVASGDVMIERAK